MDIWMSLLIVLVVVTFKYLLDIPTADEFPYKVIYRLIYLYGVISYTMARLIEYTSGESFAVCYRKFLMFFVPNPKTPVKLNVRVEIAYFKGVKARLYRNKCVPKGFKTPAFIFIHGGGYVTGSPDVYDGLLQKLCHDLGFFIAAPFYTLAPEGKFPAAFDECLSLCKCLSEISEEFSIDKDRIVISGDSAGGQIAASVVQALCKDLTTPNPKAKVLMYPCTQFLDMRTPSYRKTQWLHGERAGILNHITMSIFLSFYLFSREDDSFVTIVHGNKHVPKELNDTYSRLMKRLNHKKIPDELKNPYFYREVEEKDYDSPLAQGALPLDHQEILFDYRLCPILGELEGLPLTYVITCGVDVLRDDGILYCKNLEEANVRVVHKHYEKAFHGEITFPRRVIPSAGEMRDDLFAFLRENI
ncbi:Arylacetamide deacetylase [Holothuria leucospilota]|uniref:Arylacetamide deacetylase n=1 Tax=Holothuria leucospilota TaxID=206669 RepID=A0A9Q0YNX8_HOLLE|nr:Arylacetamide deacetylase [Holothuria leucospilota]